MAAEYKLPKLSYGYKDLEPHMSEEQLTIHHTKHHQAYVNGANGIFDKLAAARKGGEEVDMKSTLKSLAFNVGGHVLHSLFWENLAPAKESGKPSTELMKAIKNEFGSLDRFKDEFSKAAATVEGSGWAALAYSRKTKKLMIMQVEKHQVNIYPMFDLLLVLDVWEHAYYLDYKNARPKFIESFWNIVNWKEVSRRFSE